MDNGNTQAFQLKNLCNSQTINVCIRTRAGTNTLYLDVNLTFCIGSYTIEIKLLGGHKVKGKQRIRVLGRNLPTLIDIMADTRRSDKRESGYTGRRCSVVTGRDDAEVIAGSRIKPVYNQLPYLRIS